MSLLKNISRHIYGETSIFDSMIIAGFFIAIAYWMLDSILNIFYSDKFNLIAQLIGPDVYDIYTRLVVLSLFLLFGSHAQVTINNRKKAEKELDEYRLHLEDLVKQRTEKLISTNDKLKHEIRERLLSEQALKESEAKYRALIENASDAIFILQDGKVRFANPKTVEFGQFLATEIRGSDFLKFVHPKERDLFVSRQQRCLDGKKTSYVYPIRLVNDRQEELWVELNATLIKWAGKKATLNFLRDTTERRELEQHFYQAQKMESIGRLAGGIAHDFNNLLMGIQGNVSVMLMDAKPSDPLFESILSIDRCVKSGSKLTKQLLGYARGGKYDVKPTDIRQIVNKTGAMFGRTNKDITIELDSSDGLSIVEVDQGQIEQVLLNLCLNAREAMPTGGRLSFGLDNVWLDEFYFEAKPYKMPVGKYVRISVTDTGVGMDKETQNKVFEPFFTTRGIGKGAGLGLASAFGIVKNHGGLINCYSEKGLGTTFNIYLPASTRMPESEAQPYGLFLQGGTETILLVDDEELVRDASEKLLSRLGYTVILAAGGNEAIDLYAKHQQDIDLVILDIIMPDKSGQEVYENLRSINPEVKVLFASGYSQFAKRVEHSQANGFIQKPFDTHRLAGKIREALADGGIVLQQAVPNTSAGDETAADAPEEAQDPGRID